MNEQFSYIFLLLPILAIDILILVFFWSPILRNKKTIIATVVFFCLPWYFVVDILAVRVWHIWSYGANKILGIWLAGTALEEFLWIILVSFLFSSITVVFAERMISSEHGKWIEIDSWGWENSVRYRFRFFILTCEKRYLTLLPLLQQSFDRLRRRFFYPARWTQNLLRSVNKLSAVCTIWKWWQSRYFIKVLSEKYVGKRCM